MAAHSSLTDTGKALVPEEVGKMAVWIYRQREGEKGEGGKLRAVSQDSQISRQAYPSYALISVKICVQMLSRVVQQDGNASVLGQSSTS